MNRKQFFMLLAAVLVLGAVTFMTMKREETGWQDASGRVGQNLLDLDINKVAGVTLTGPKSASATLITKDGKWRVKERNEYAVDFKDLSELLIKLREMKIVQVDGVAPDQRARLELTMPSAEENTGTMIELHDAAGKTLTAVLVGKEFMRGGAAGSASYPIGRFVMVGKDAAALKDAKSVYVVGDVLPLASAKPAGWLDKTFFKVEKLKSITVKSEDAARSWGLMRAKADDFWALQNSTASEKIDQVAANQAAAAFENTLFQDVAAGVSNDTAGLTAPTSVDVETFDGLHYALKIGNKEGDQRYVNIVVTGDPAKQRTAEAGEKAEDKEKLDKAFKDTLQALETRLAHERALAQWTYLIPGWKLEALLRTRAQLLMDDRKAASAAAEAAARGGQPPLGGPGGQPLGNMPMMPQQ